MKRRVARTYRKHERSIAIGIAVATSFVILTIICIRTFMIEPVGAKRLVTIYDRGTPHVVLTRAQTVQEAIDASDIRLNPDDEVEPSRQSRLEDPQMDIVVYRSRMVGIVDGSVRQTVVTIAQSPNAIVEAAGLPAIGPDDKAVFKKGSIDSEGPVMVLAVERVKKQSVVEESPKPPAYVPLPNALTVSKGAQIFVDSIGVAHRETYYDLPMNIVIRACGPSNTYTIRSDGAKVDQDGYVLVAANLGSYPRCTVVETSLGPGKVYDTGGFAVKHPYGFDLATDWTNYNGL